MIRGLIFDFDGLILDTELPTYRAWLEVYQAHGHELSLETWSAGVGTWGGFDPHADLEARCGRSLDPEVVHTRRRLRVQALLADEVARPGVRAYLADASRLGLRLGVASSSPIDWVEGHLERLGIRSAFGVVSCAGDGVPAKPAPDVYQCALETLGLDPREAIALEDSAHGTTAARAAGLFCVAVPNQVTACLRFDHANLCLSSLADLPLEHLIATATARLSSGKIAAP